MHNIQPCVIHRDLKPENIMISERGNIVKILDFGLSRTLDKISQMSKKTQSEGGTANYMSPQSMNREVSYACDTWSWALITNEMAAQEIPFDGLTIF